MVRAHRRMMKTTINSEAAILMPEGGLTLKLVNEDEFAERCSDEHGECACVRQLLGFLLSFL